MLGNDKYLSVCELKMNYTSCGPFLTHDYLTINKPFYLIMKEKFVLQ